MHVILSQRRRIPRKTIGWRGSFAHAQDDKGSRGDKLLKFKFDQFALKCYISRVMTILKIVKYPDPVLKKVASPITKVTPDVTRLLDDMAETMYAEPGVGLAAPQVGLSLRCIVIDTGIETPDGKMVSNLHQLINPEITVVEGEIEWEEGCLSIPDFTVKMDRFAKVHVTALDKYGKNVEIDADGLLSIALQHEIDHLDGKLLIDNVSRLKRELYLRSQKKKQLKDKEPVYL